MTKLERRRLKALAKRLERAGYATSRESHRVYKNAGHDGPGGTGDEGWREAFILDGTATGLLDASRQLEKLLKELDAKHLTRAF